MPSSLFGGQNQNGSFKQSSQPANKVQSFLEFAQNFRTSGLNPAVIGQQMVDSGRISKEQLEFYGSIADRLVGRKR